MRRIGLSAACLAAIAASAEAATLVVDRCAFQDCGGEALSLSPNAEPGAGPLGARVTRCLVTGGTSGLLAGGAGLVLDRNRVEGTTTYDLWDQQVGGTNEYGRNTFRTSLFGSPP